MLKFTDTQVTFAEVPDEITLCINISNCPCHCKGCHSAYLAEDIGTPLDEMELTSLIEANRGITCVAFMGGDVNPEEINLYAAFIKGMYPGIKVAWYSGRQELSKDIDLMNFDYIKLGPYDEDKGSLNKRTTNQRFYKVFHFSTGRCELIDITHKFWREDD